MSFREFMTERRTVRGPAADAATAWGKAGLSTAGVFIPGVGNVVSAIDLAGEYKEAVARTAHAIEYGRDDVKAADDRVTGALVREDMNGLDPSERRSYADALGRFAEGDRTVSAIPDEGEAAAVRLDYDLGAHRESHQAYLESARDQARSHHVEAATPMADTRTEQQPVDLAPTPVDLTSAPQTDSHPEPTTDAAAEVQLEQSTPDEAAASEESAAGPDAEGPRPAGSDETPEPMDPAPEAAPSAAGATPVGSTPEPERDPEPASDATVDPEPSAPQADPTPSVEHPDPQSNATHAVLEPETGVEPAAVTPEPEGDAQLTQEAQAAPSETTPEPIPDPDLGLATPDGPTPDAEPPAPVAEPTATPPDPVGTEPGAAAPVPEPLGPEPAAPEPDPELEAEPDPPPESEAGV